MKQITRAIYAVEAGEEVTIEVEATRVGNFVVFALDGSTINAEPGISPITYKFTVTVGAGFDHFGIVSCHFPNAAPDDAEYQVFLSGSEGGGKFTGPNILKRNLSWQRSLEFRHL